MLLVRSVSRLFVCMFLPLRLFVFSFARTSCLFVAVCVGLFDILLFSDCLYFVFALFVFRYFVCLVYSSRLYLDSGGYLCFIILRFQFSVFLVYVCMYVCM